MKQRPYCAHCGIRYGKRDTKQLTVKWDTPCIDKTIGGKTYKVLNGPIVAAPPYEGGDMLIKESKPYLSVDGQVVMRRTIWDGLSYMLPYEPFCTLRCALAYAREAYRQGRK